jgi:SAM-dependent MidA family methyltransferase
MQPSQTRPAEPAILEALRARAGGESAVSFADFMDVALYAPAIGYYRRPARRVGYAEGTDFLTATASAPAFGRLVAAACVRLVGPDVARSEFVEIGAERGAGILRGLDHPFRSTRQIGVGEEIRIEGPSVVFSNELLDAQPFRRFRFRSGAWRELGVALGPGELSEVELDRPEALPSFLPRNAPPGYVIDAPLAAAALARRIGAQAWRGLFLAFDYGKSWEEIAYATPAGTARSYRHHAQRNELLDCAGGQDLTCHVCWDWIAESLRGVGFGEPQLESQEAFFVRHAGPAIEAIAVEQAGRLSRDKLSLLQLLHPANLGQRFQVLWALRG